MLSTVLWFISYGIHSFIHSFIKPLDRRWGVVPAILLDHWLCSMRHQQRVLCQLPVVASTDGEASHVDVSTAVCCRGGALTARRSAMWAGVTSGSCLTWPNIVWRRLVILSRTLSYPVRFMMVALVTKSYQRIPSIRRWHDMLNASSFFSSATLGKNIAMAVLNFCLGFFHVN